MARLVSPVENANKMQPGGQDGTFDKKKPVKEPRISLGNCEGEDVSSGVPVLTDLPTQENNNYRDLKRAILGDIPQLAPQPVLGESLHFYQPPLDSQ